MENYNKDVARSKRRIPLPPSNKIKKPKQVIKKKKCNKSEFIQTECSVSGKKTLHEEEEEECDDQYEIDFIDDTNYPTSDYTDTPLVKCNCLYPSCSCLPIMLMQTELQRLSTKIEKLLKLIKK